MPVVKDHFDKIIYVFIVFVVDSSSESFDYLLSDKNLLFVSF